LARDVVWLLNGDGPGADGGDRGAGDRAFGGTMSGRRWMRSWIGREERRDRGNDKAQAEDSGHGV